MPNLAAGTVRAGLLAACLLVTAASARDPQPTVLDDVPQPLTGQPPRTEAEADRIDALAMFSAGRMLQHRGQDAEALRLYERAWRCDPEAAAVGRAIVPLAYRLGRHAEAVRYALKVVESESGEGDPILLRHLGVYLSEEGQWQDAVKFYERAVASRVPSGCGQKETAADVLLRMELGRLYHLVQEYKKAAECFDHVLAAMEHPKDYGLDEKLQEILLGEAGSAYNLFGECYLLSDRPKEAAVAFEKSNKAAPNNGLLQFSLARMYARTGKPQEALAALDSCFGEKLADEGMAPYELLAEVLEKLGRKDDLIGRLEKLRSEDPGNLPLGYYLATRYMAAGQLDKAEPLLRMLLDKNPTLTGYRNLIDIYLETKRTEDLLRILGETAEKAGVLETLGVQTKTIAGDPAVIGALIETARKRFKESPQKLDYGMRLAVALLAMESKQIATAGEFFELALKSKPAKPQEILLAWGVGLLFEERSAEAAKVFQRGIDPKAKPEENLLFHFYLAGALALEGRTEEALAAARQAAEIKPKLARFQSRPAWVLYYAKRYDEAQKAYEALLTKFDSDYNSTENREVLRDARLVLSNICVLRDQLPKAEEWLEQVLDEFPDDVGAMNDLGYLWADQNKHLGRALGMIQRSVAAEPDNAAYRDSLGWVLFRLGRVPEAVSELEKAAAAKADAEVLDHLGDAYLKANDAEKAKDAWRRAVAAFKKEKEPQKAKQVEKKLIESPTS